MPGGPGQQNFSVKTDISRKINKNLKMSII
jgi:hypothetical protein